MHVTRESEEVNVLPDRTIKRVTVPDDLYTDFLKNLEDVKKAYLGTYETLNEFIDEEIIDALYELMVNAYEVDSSKPGYLKFRVDVESFPKSGSFFYIPGEKGQIHVFRAIEA